MVQVVDHGALRPDGGPGFANTRDSIPRSPHMGIAGPAYCLHLQCERCSPPAATLPHAQDLINPARGLRTLRLFCAVAQSGSITQGARHCHLALSAASRRLSDFEAAAGAQLLERSARGVVLTAAGRLALQHAARLFQGFELFSNELSEHASGARGHVRLWANMSALVQFLPATLADFMARSPGTRVEVEEQLSGDIARAVQDGLADLGICAAGVPGAA